MKRTLAKTYGAMTDTLASVAWRLIETVAALRKWLTREDVVDSEPYAVEHFNGEVCPLCSGRELIGGPRGGLAQNICCADCHTEYWYAPPFETYIVDRSAEEKHQIYSLTPVPRRKV